MKRLTLFRFVATLFVLVNAGVLFAQTYNESGGFVIMEMENTPSALGQWVKINPGGTNYVSGATGSGHLEFTGNTINGGDAASPLTYTLTISGRSIRFNLDRIVFRLSSVAVATARDASLPESSFAGGGGGTTDNTVTQFILVDAESDQDIGPLNDGDDLGLNWNLGEENGALGSPNQSTAQRKAMAQYFHDHDPYAHNIVIHNGKAPDDLLGSASWLTGYSLQTNNAAFVNVFAKTKEFVDKSANANRPWVVACDEPGDAQHSLRPVGDTGNSWVDGRKNALWGNVMAGGAGLEFYFGYAHDHSDLTCEDYRSRDGFWDYGRHMLEFFPTSKCRSRT